MRYKEFIDLFGFWFCMDRQLGRKKGESRSYYNVETRMNFALGRDSGWGEREQAPRPLRVSPWHIRSGKSASCGIENL